MFALIKTGLIVGLAVLAFTSLNETFNLVQESVINESVLYPPLKKLALEIFPYIQNIITSAK